MGSMAWLFSFILFTSFLSSTISDDGTGGIVTNQDGDASLRADDQSAPQEGDSHPTDDHGSDQHYHDTTNFLTGVNGWDFIGSWAKYDLKVLQEAQVAVQAVPLVPDSQDQGVFICQASAFPSFLEKEFPALHDATFQLTYYVMSPNKDLTMTGEVVGAGTTTETLFSYSYPDDLLEHNDTWVTQTFNLPSLAGDDKFKVRVVLRSQSTGVWAASELRVAGLQSPPTAAPILPTPPPTTTTQMTVNVTTEESPMNVTTEESPLVNGTTEESPLVNGTTEESPLVNVTTEESPMNVTMEESPLVNGTTEESPLVNGTTDEPDENVTAAKPIVNVTTVAPNRPSNSTVSGGLTDSDEPQVEVGKLANVAQAIWDAFYVFLALFCACLVALVALIVHGRCKHEDEPPPAVATYNPRNASYRLDKVYDNPAYDNNAA